MNRRLRVQVKAFELLQRDGVFPTDKHLAQELGMSESNISKVVSTLRQARVITGTRGRRAFARWVVQDVVEASFLRFFHDAAAARLDPSNGFDLRESVLFAHAIRDRRLRLPSEVQDIDVRLSELLRLARRNGYVRVRPMMSETLLCRTSRLREQLDYLVGILLFYGRLQQRGPEIRAFPIDFELLPSSS